MKKSVKKILLGLITVVVALIATACSSGSGGNEVKVGIMGSDTRIWDVIKTNLQKEGINIKLVQFNDYDQPNQALAGGDIDLNAYQHVYFLENWNNARKTNLTAIGNTVIAPLSVYSDKIKSLNDLPNGGTIALPNDVTNQARALQLLESAGVLKLKSDVKLPSPNDVVDNPKNIKLMPLDASQTARSLSEVSVSVVNNTVALDAKLDLNSAIFREPITEKSKPWINVIATKPENKDNETYKKIVAAYQTQEVADKIKEVYQGSTIPAWDYKF